MIRYENYSPGPKKLTKIWIWFDFGQFSSPRTILLRNSWNILVLFFIFFLKNFLQNIFRKKIWFSRELNLRPTDTIKNHLEFVNLIVTAKRPKITIFVVIIIFTFFREWNWYFEIRPWSYTRLFKATPARLTIILY